MSQKGSHVKFIKITEFDITNAKAIVAGSTNWNDERITFFDRSIC
ncbi:hypothetical protein LEP1GSC086_2583 [Leptospira weilii str. LNT 1234]|nr:hypothetical protein LEP1GSC086_2583 [Leptospira weilii str. LNT 1234]